MREMKFKLLSREGIVIIICICIRGERIIYFNIREKESVIQASFKGGNCNLLF
jgi:hypothetical protein